jgi:hypothetical protein
MHVHPRRRCLVRRPLCPQRYSAVDASSRILHVYNLPSTTMVNAGLFGPHCATLPHFWKVHILWRAHDRKEVH